MGLISTKGPADSNCWSPQEKILSQSRLRRFYAKLSKFIYSVKSINKWLSINFFEQFFGFIFISNIFRIGFSLVDYKSDNIDFHEMNIL